MRTLCQDWFPIDYPLSWYEDITSSSRFFSLAAVYNLAIIGLIVAEIKPYKNLNKEVSKQVNAYKVCNRICSCARNYRMLSCWQYNITIIIS